VESARQRLKAKGKGQRCVLGQTGLEAQANGPAWEQLGWGVLSRLAGEGEVVLGWVG